LTESHPGNNRKEMTTGKSRRCELTWKNKEYLMGAFVL